MEYDKLLWVGFIFVTIVYGGTVACKICFICCNKCFTTKKIEAELENLTVIVIQPEDICIGVPI